MTETSASVLSYPFGPAEALELHPNFARLRREMPVARVQLPYGGMAWLITRYEDVKAVMADSRFSKAPPPDAPRTMPLSLSDLFILAVDPPEHTRLRRPVAGVFTARRVEGLRPRVQQIVDELLDGMVEAGQPADLVACLGWPLPVMVICELLGVPFADHARFREWTESIVTVSDAERVRQAAAALRAYLGDQVQQRRTEPTDDLLGALVTTAQPHGELTEHDIVGLAMSLLIAGHETTANQIGKSVYVLLTQPSLWERVVTDPAVVPAAVEELLRYAPLGTTVSFPRIATEDVEVGGQLIRAGETVLAEGASGNRDAAVFDHPDDIDFDRTQNPHLAFGHGIHHCLGAQLARLELQVALVELSRRCPRLRLAIPPEQITWRSGQTVRGVLTLPVTW